MKTFTKRIAKLTETIEKLISDMEQKSEEKRDAFDNKSETWQESEKWQETEFNLDRIDECISELENARDCISEFTEE